MIDANIPATMDFARIREITLDDTAFQRELLEIYVTDSAERIEKLGKSLNAGDTNAFRREAHALGGSSGSVGANVIHALSYALEKTNPSEDPGKTKALLDSIQQSFEQACGLIENYLAALPKE